MFRFLDVVEGFLVCAFKGFKIPFTNDRGMRDNWFGFSHPSMAPHWQRVRNRNTAHNLTNLIVEWNRLDAQRGAKVTSAVMLLTGMFLFYVFSHIF